MFDSDLAKLYGCKNGTKTINQAVKRHLNRFPDRFIIIDNNLYHIGSSLKDLGKKCFAINKIEYVEILERILEKIWYN